MLSSIVGQSVCKSISRRLHLTDAMSQSHTQRNFVSLEDARALTALKNQSQEKGFFCRGKIYGCQIILMYNRLHSSNNKRLTCAYKLAVK